MRNLIFTSIFSTIIACGGGGGGGVPPLDPNIESPTETKDEETNPPPGASAPSASKKCGDLLEGETAERTRYESSWAVTAAECKSEVQKATCSHGTLSNYSGSYIWTSCSALATYCSESSRNAWSSYSASSQEGDDGSTTKPYKICNKSQFLDLTRKCGGTQDDGTACQKSYLLMANIDLENQVLVSDDMIGSPAKTFSGNFDGNGLTVSSLNLDLSTANPPIEGVGLFSKASGNISNLKVSGTVKGTKYVGLVVGHGLGNLTNIEASGNVVARSFYSLETSTTHGATWVGGVVGNSSGNLKTIRSSVNVDGSFGVKDYARFSSWVGGVVGYSSILSKTLKIEDVKFSGEVRGFSYVGGIVGQSNNTELLDLENSGSVYGISSIGGIAGDIQKSSSTSFTDFNTYKNLLSSGSLYYNAKFDADGVTSAGGIIGSASKAKIENAKTTVAINISNATRLGGIVGNSNDSELVTVENTKSITGNDDVGGIIGKAENTKITGVISSGAVSGRELVGGVVGNAISMWTGIINAQVTGNVSGTRKVGGLFGEGWTRIAGSQVNNTVTGTDTFVGGFAGNLTCSNCGTIVEQSFFNGTVTSTGNFVGGLFGAMSSTNLRNVYANAAVTGGASFVGGLAGACYGDIRTSYFRGSVAATTSFYGPIAGEVGSGCNFVNVYYSSADVTLPASPNNFGTSFSSKSNMITAVNANWDTVDVWKIDALINSGWPVLKHFYP